MVEPITLFLISIALQVVGYLLAPKPTPAKPPEVEDIKTPTAQEGRPIPIPFGDVRVRSPNYLWFGDKAVGRRMVKAKS